MQIGDAGGEWEKVGDGWGTSEGQEGKCLSWDRRLVGPVPKRLPYRSFRRNYLSDEWRVGGSGCLEPRILVGPGGRMVWGELCLVRFEFLSATYSCVAFRRPFFPGSPSFLIGWMGAAAAAAAPVLGICSVNLSCP